MKNITVGELRKALEGVPDDVAVTLSSDSGVDQGEGEIVIESARYVTYNTKTWGTVRRFDIYANDSGRE